MMGAVTSSYAFRVRVQSGYLSPGIKRKLKLTKWAIYRVKDYRERPEQKHLSVTVVRYQDHETTGSKSL